MLEQLKEWDEQLFMLINGLHSDFFDFIMYWASDKFIWIPLYLYFTILIYKKRSLKGLYSILFIGLAIAITDQATTHLFKEVFLRLRPCNNTSLQTLIHLVNNNCGGQYGFISAHVANSFALASFLYLLIGNDFKFLKYILGTWLFIIAYSRVYLAAHYPGDVLGGAIFGTAIGIAVFKLYLFVQSRIYKSSHE